MKTSNENNQLNAYTITWAILTPANGKKITKKDLNQIYKTSGRAFGQSKSLNEGACHFKNKQSAIDCIKKIKGLNKNYSVIFITDKQFGLSKWNQKKIEVATKMQLINQIII